MNHLIARLLALNAFFISSLLVADDSPSLRDEILSMDAILFDAFNSCDVETMGRVFSKDLEFFHDTAGLSGYEDTMRVTVQNCERNLGLVRELEVETTSVYPIKDYGAMQEGRHTFCHIENGENDCGTFEFLHIWQETDGQWQLTRVISWGH